ncbi:hypothetical protein [Spongiactinospora sp. TRM90649]|uniref:effector-associated constant component EACC1 n=1 Tax=Spongiactinospora sp. TRM90649 TaxID=3031114 RepID=UPI0023F79F73|nr:hypothetical protein [Spongiactinospora sp. TRM90649]MDF5753512.1 hypothetical protein [Spongiactinospora sp. TRM90649]
MFCGRTTPSPGAMGPVAECLRIIADAPEVVGTVAGPVVARLRYRTSDVKLTAERISEGIEVELEARRVRSLDAEQARAWTKQIEAALNADRPQGP